MNVSSSLNQSPSHANQMSSNPQSQSVSWSQSTYQTRQSSITMKTAEGDVVTISGYAAAGNQVEQTGWRGANQAGLSFSEVSMQNNSLQMTVNGDLSEEELQDIKNLLNDLQQISSSFFAGDSAKAMQDALAIGDMGSISELEASFQHTAYASVQYAGQHPLSGSLDGQLRKMQEELDHLTSRQRVPFDQLLQAQWGQIEDFLSSQNDDEAQTQSPTAPEPPADTSLESFMTALKNRIDETITSHPRLSPYTLPVARQALQNAQPAEHSSQQRHGHGAAMLNRSIMKGLSNWLLSA